MPSLVAIIQADVDHIRIALRNLIYLYAHTLQAGQIARRRRVRAGGGFGGRIYGIHIEVLIAVVILGVEDVLAVSRPEISGDRPLDLRGEETRRAEGLIHGLHINIPSVFPGLQKGDVLSIGRKLSGRNLRVAKDYIAVNELRRTARLVCDCSGEGRKQEYTHEDEAEFQEFHMRQFLSADTWNARRE